MKKILITGAAGFVGTNLSHYLLKNGYEVIGVDLSDRHERLASSSLLKESNFTFKEIDLAKDILPETIIQDVSAIFHLAALPHVDYSYFYPKRTINNNIQSLVNVLESAKNNSIPFILSSSVEVYGGSIDQIYTEEHLLAPLSPYAASKVASEAIVKTYVETQNINATIFRFTNLYGPWQAPDRLLPRVITQILSDDPVHIEKGTNRDFVFIDDACEVLERAITFTHAGEVFNLSSGVRHDNYEAVQKVLDLLPYENVNIMAPRKNDGRGKYLIASPDKLHARTGWDTTTSFEIGLNTTAQWYVNNITWLEQFLDNISADRQTPNFLTDSGLNLEYWDA